MITEHDFPSDSTPDSEYAQQVMERTRAIEEGWRVLTPGAEQVVSMTPMGELSDVYDIPNPVIAEIDAGESRFAIFRDPNSGRVYGCRMNLKNTNVQDGKKLFLADDKTVFDITETSVVVGRGSKELSDDPSLSKNHFSISIDNNGKLRIEDQRSTNGTLVRFATEQADTTQETYVDSRRRKLFAPPMVVKPNSENDTTVSLGDVDVDEGYLFGDYDVVTEPKIEAEISAKPFEVTAEKQQHAADVLAEAQKATPEINEILANHGVSTVDPREVSTAVRENADLRWDLAQAFLNKVDRISYYLPYRVKNNTQRSLSFRGYEKLSEELGKVTSREYVARMCLNLLDGTYDPTREMDTADPIRQIYTSDGSMVIEQGQHRYSAYRVLMDRE